MGLEAGTLPYEGDKEPERPLLTLSPRVGISSLVSSPGFALLFCLCMRVTRHLANPSAVSVLCREGSVLPLWQERGESKPTGLRQLLLATGDRHPPPRRVWSFLGVSKAWSSQCLTAWLSLVLLIILTVGSTA